MTHSAPIRPESTPVRSILFITSILCLLFILPFHSRAATGSTSSSTESQLAQQRQALEAELRQLETRLNTIREQLQTMDNTSTPSEASATDSDQSTLKKKEVQMLTQIDVVAKRIQRLPVGITRDTSQRSSMENQPAKDFRESLESIPGIVLRQRNGPRDFSISIRGFGAKQGFGVQKVKMYEDGFSLTQSDGLSRLDLPDPWFMQATDVERGASSAMHGNFALGGIVNFRTRRGRDIRGMETLTQAGSYGYQKYATAIGEEYERMDAAVFVSHERGDGFRAHSEFATTTVDANFRFKIDDRQSMFVKIANNDLEVKTPQRLTLGQFQTQPKQAGTGAKSNDRSRSDHRTIIGAKYTNRITPNTEASVTAEYDNKDINQKFGITLDQVQPNWKTRADVHHATQFSGMAFRSHIGIFYDYLESESTNFRNAADFHATKLNAINNSRGRIQNLGIRLREEVDFLAHWTLGAGMGFEWSRVSVNQVNFGFTTGTFSSRTNASRAFHNVAPDVSLTYHPNDHAQYWGRISGGYGIPNLGNLTTASTGLPGANLALEDESNINLEFGGKVQLHPRFKFLLVGFWTFFNNELISVTNAVGSFTTNADASEYRGIELGWEWVPLDGLVIAGAYTYVDARFINFTDTLTTGTVNRDGNTVPAVEPHVFNLRTAYDHPSGFGGWIEVSWLDDYFVNNANTLKAQAATVVNVNGHFTKPVNWGWVRFVKGFVQIDNLLDQTYMGSGAIVSDNTADTAKQAFLLAPPLSVFTGVTLGLF